MGFKIDELRDLFLIFEVIECHYLILKNKPIRLFI